MKFKKGILTTLITPLLFTSWGNSGEYVIKDSNLNANIIQDNYDTYYQIFVGSFSDSNNDGIGDIKGIINRLDYLNDGDPNSGKSLGITGIWLTPIFNSTSYHKYDVIDYYEIDEDFGTLDDLKQFIAACHTRDIKLIIDLPINHTSTINSWYGKFVQALRNNDTENQYYDFYSSYKKEEIPSSITCKQIAGTDYYYECNFSDSMPELNFDSNEVRQEVVNIAKYYLDLGIDGFRFDAAKYIYFNSNQKSVEFWNWYMTELKKIKEDIYCVGEIWDNDNVITPYYQSMNCFEFTMAQGEGKIAATTKGRNTVNNFINYIISRLNTVKKQNSNAILNPFIANHDTDRAAGFLHVDKFQMQLAANLYLLSSGNPFIYYGEEIGMKGSRGSANTDANRRLAMLWGDEDKVKNPPESSFSKDNQINGTVSSQLNDKNSLYNYYKKLIMIRNANPEIARGNYTSLNLTISDEVGGFIASYNNKNVAVIHNLGLEEIKVSLRDYNQLSNMKINSYIGKGKAKIRQNTLTISPQTSVILR